MSRRFVFVVVVALTALTTSLASAMPAADLVIDSAAHCCSVADRLAPPDPPPPPSDPVFVIGDSLFVGVVSPLFVGTGNTLQDRLAATGRTVFTSAEVGRSVPQAVQVVLARAADVDSSNVALVGLGTNDLFGSAGTSVSAARARIDQMIGVLRTINPDIRLVWVDVSVEAQRGRTLVWNAALAEAADDHIDVEVCAWRTIVLQHPEWVAGDGIHLTGTGYAARRDVLIECVIERSP